MFLLCSGDAGLPFAQGGQVLRLPAVKLSLGRRHGSLRRVRSRRHACVAVSFPLAQTGLLQGDGLGIQLTGASEIRLTAARLRQLGQHALPSVVGFPVKVRTGSGQGRPLSFQAPLQLGIPFGKCSFQLLALLGHGALPPAPLTGSGHGHLLLADASQFTVQLLLRPAISFSLVLA